MIFNLIIFLLSFLGLWFGSGLIVRSVETLSKRLHLPSFTTSFFILGILTSMPETLIGVSSIISGSPQIFVGNLIGASLVLFILAIPILSILGNGIKLTHQLERRNLLLSLFVVASPVFFIIDRQVNIFEGFFMIALYFLLYTVIGRKGGLITKIADDLSQGKNHVIEDLGQIFLGAVLIFLASKILVDQTVFLSETLQVTSFLLSLLVLSLGTNLPELSLAVRSILLGKKEVAFGDYIGSAVANTLIFGVLTVLSGGVFLPTNHFFQTFIFMIAGLSTFYFFSRSKNDISRIEGLVLLFIYFLFFLSEAIL